MIYVNRRNLAKYLEESTEPLAQVNWEQQLRRKHFWADSLVAQLGATLRLGVHTFIAEGPGLIPGRETKIHKSHSTAKKKKIWSKQTQE